MASQNDAPSMQYTIAPNDSRRDVDAGPAQFNTLGQALGTHHLANGSAYRPTVTPEYSHRLSPSHVSPQLTLKRKLDNPGRVNVNGNGVVNGSGGGEGGGGVMQKRRRDREREREREREEDPEGFDAGQGAKHWTDEEKAKLFNWLMGPGQDDRWNALRATKNSCLRECASVVFGGKKTYQALKGCYERNFNLFKQIYAYESWAHQLGSHVPNGLSEADRLKEYERRLQGAKKAGCDVGNITARTVDHWLRSGWYQLFYTRWHGDPATTKPVVPRGGGSSHPGGADDDVDLDDTSMDFTDSNLAALSNSHEPLTFINQQPPPPPPPPPQAQPQTMQHQNQNQNPNQNGHPHNPHPHSIPHPHPTPHPQSTPHPHSTHHSSPHRYPTPHTQPHHQQLHSLPAHIPPSPRLVPPPPPPPLPMSMPMSPTPEHIGLSNGTSNGAGSGSGVGTVNLPLPQNMLNAVMQYLQFQTQTSKMKLDYLRRREEREEKESQQRREFERMRMEREQAEFEHNRQQANLKQRADKAIEILQNPNLDPVYKAAAGDYLKKVFNGE